MAESLGALYSRTTLLWLLLALSVAIGVLGARETPWQAWVQLERARQEYEYWASEWKRAQELYRQGLLSERDLQRTEHEFRKAALAYQEARLLAQGTLFRIHVEQAVKYRERDGSIRVRLLLRRGASGVDLPGDVPTGPVYVSVVNLQGTVVGLPYERRLESLALGQSVALEFALLEDNDVIRVRFTEGGQTYEFQALLERRDRESRLTVGAEPFSQAVDFGGQATYRLKLEYFGTRPETYQLRVSGLPPAISYDFQDADTQVRVTLIRLDPMTRTRTLLLVIYLPDRPVGPVKVDHTISFRVEAIPQGTSLSGSGVGISLQLIPRGVGRLKLSVTNLYEEIRPGQAVTREWKVANTGERALERVSLRVEPPWQWRVLVSPETVERLAPGEEGGIQVTLQSPPDAAVGDYEAAVWAVGWTGTQQTQSEVLRLRVHVKSQGSVMGTAILLGVLVLVLIGIVSIGIHLMRK